MGRRWRSHRAHLLPSGRATGAGLLGCGGRLASRGAAPPPLGRARLAGLSLGRGGRWRWRWLIERAQAGHQRRARSRRGARARHRRGTWRATAGERLGCAGACGMARHFAAIGNTCTAPHTQLLAPRLAHALALNAQSTELPPYASFLGHDSPFPPSFRARAHLLPPPPPRAPGPRAAARRALRDRRRPCSWRWPRRSPRPRLRAHTPGHRRRCHRRSRWARLARAARRGLGRRSGAWSAMGARARAWRRARRRRRMRAGAVRPARRPGRAARRAGATP
jgi:hypothetical protein